MRHFRLSALLVRTFLSLVVMVNAAYGQEPQVRPDLNSRFVDPDFQQWAARFERPGREVYDQRQQIVAATGIKAGMSVADIGAGTGLFTRLFSRQVGASGKVYAVDISKVFVDNILRLSRERGQRNVEGVVGSATDARLPRHSIDLAFICDTYHHFEKPLAMMRSIRRALKPRGEVIVIDFRKMPGVSTAWVMGHVRAGQLTVVREIESAGFRLVEDSHLLQSNYFLRFETGDER